MPDPLTRVACFAMNTRFELVLGGRDEAYRRAAGEEAIREIQALDRQLSLYRDDSDVREINVVAGERPVPLEPRLFALLQRAAELSRQTEGAFDPTVGPLLRTWGFAGEGGRVPAEAEIAAALGAVGVRHLEFDPEAGTLRYGRPGMMLDLGAIGKGYAIERAVEVLRDLELECGLLHGGTSSVYALGAPPGAPAGWKVAIRHPTVPERQIAETVLRDRALGVSAPHGRFFTHGSERYGHVIDPRTGVPTRAALLSAVLADNPTEADALSTALLTLGPTGLETIGARWPGTSALVATAGPGAEVEVATLNWSPV